MRSQLVTNQNLNFWQMSKIFLALTLFSGICGPVAAQEKADVGAKILIDAKALTGRTTSARRTYIESQLEETSIKYERRPWQSNRGKGVNLELRFGPKEGKATLFSTHFDVRRGSAGANNNASGSAVLMHLVKAAAKLTVDPKNNRQLIFLFLDGSESRFAGATAFCDLYSGEHFQSAFNFELCGRGDQLAVGPSATPLANSAVALAQQVATDAKIKLSAWPNFFPGDHRIFARYGLDAATISVIPSAQLSQSQERFGKNNRKAPLPRFYNEAIRSRDEAKTLDPKALALAAHMGLQLINQETDSRSRGLPLVKDIKKKQKALIELFEKGEFEEKRDAIRDIGFNGTVAFILRHVRKDPELMAKFEKLILRLFSGQALRGEVKNLLLKGLEHSVGPLTILKQKITWDTSGHYYKCLP
ncbi:MAG: hypothetical protein ACI97A_001509 [Planctomycetota bacterium]|jgi:hypothetical protein